MAMWTHNEGPRVIVVALDGSPTAEIVLPFALTTARAFDAELLLFRVVPALGISLALVAGTKTADVEPAPHEDELVALAYLEAVAENLRTKGVRVTVRTCRGQVVSSIVEEAARCDLLMLANHGAGGLSHLVLGNIAEQVLALCPCATLLIPVPPLHAQDGHSVRSFFNDISRLGPLVQRPLGLRTVAVERIVGSVGRATELRGDFLPRDRPAGDHRFRRIKRAMEEGAVMPPIDLYKFGYDYYVLDGHHRVAAARALGQLEIDAVVTEFMPLNNEDVHRVFSERRQFEDSTGLSRVGATRPGHYQRLQDMIDEYAEQQQIVDRRDAALQWYTHVYLPRAARIRAARLGSLFPGERTADLVVHVEDLRLADEVRTGQPVSWEDALQSLVTRYRSSRRHARLRLPVLGGLLQRSR